MLTKLAKGAIGYFVPFLGQVKAARSWLTLLAVAAVAGWLYYQFATVQRDRDALLGFARISCATAGTQFDASVEQRADAKGKPVTVKLKRGEACSLRMLELSAFERDATKASNSALAGALKEHANKSEADASAAARDAAAAERAAQRMEQADNDIQKDDRLGPDWFDAFNGLAGLRKPR